MSQSPYGVEIFACCIARRDGMIYKYENNTKFTIIIIYSKRYRKVIINGGFSLFYLIIMVYYWNWTLLLFLISHFPQQIHHNTLVFH